MLQNNSNYSASPPISPPGRLIPPSPFHISNTRPLHVILDFDGTITTRDTIDTLVHAALALQHLPSADARSSANAAWAECQATYVRELDAHRATAAAARSGPGFAGDLAELGALWEVEEASVRRVGEAGIFKGVTGEMLREKGGLVAVEDGKGEGKVVVRKGFGEFIGALERDQAAWGVVSVNWSRAWIRGVLGAVLGGAERVEEVPVIANEINEETGMIEGYTLDQKHSPAVTVLLTTTTNKLKAALAMFSNFRFANPYAQPVPMIIYLDDGSTEITSVESPAVQPLTIYLGDSSTDLGPLLAADIGIIMLSPSSSCSAFTASIKARDYDVIPVKEYKDLYVPREGRQIPRFLSAWDYEEILESGVLGDKEWNPKGAMEKWCSEANDPEACGFRV